MSYGIPCPDSPNPSGVYSNVEQYDQAMGNFVAAIEAEIQAAKTEIAGLIGPAVQVLQQWIQKQLTQINKIISDIVNTLGTNLTSQTVSANVQLSSSITDIANSLNTSTTEIMYGPEPTQPQPQPFPPSTRPFDPVPIGPSQPGTIPSTSPNNPAAVATGVRPNPPATSLVQNGSPVSVTAVCNPVQVGPNVQVGGQQYTPVVTVYQSQGGMTFDPQGNAHFPLSYDPQPDGSIIVSVGPVHVHLSLPNADPSKPADACPVALNPV